MQSTPKSMFSLLQHILTKHPFWAGLAIRFLLAWFLPWFLDDGRWIPGVAYTDIDFHVFSDAADHVARGGSPYDRHTYRYTPFLAALLSKLPTRETGRYLFCLADAVCGWLILKLRRISDHNKEEENGARKLFVDGLWWMYNPLAINICTRGSAESLMVLLPVLLTIQLVVTAPGQGKSSPLWIRAGLAGILHGIAVHSKLYPIIYTLSYMAHFAVRSKTMEANQIFLPFQSTWDFIQRWTLRLLQPAPCVFLMSTLITFGSLTYLAVLWYGPAALEEGLLYHLSRVDHRHNYSFFWYMLYLGRAVAAKQSSSAAAMMSTVGRLLVFPQVALLVYSSLGIAHYDLGLALFCQTYLFVTLNKVITAQYFTWYLCLLPLCRGFCYWDARWAFVGLGLSIVMWLGSAYCLEMQGMPVHRLVWGASLVYFWANIYLMGALLQSYRTRASKNDRENIKRD